MLSFGNLFGSNFWSSFKSQPSESIEKLLKQDGCPIEDILDDSDLLQECKNSNKNLINYLDRDKIKQLIDFITVMPEEDEHNRGHKYPFVASEVFNCDISEVIDMFFIAPCDDKQPEPEEPEHEEDDEANTKFKSNFDNDQDDSSGDSEEEDSNEGEDNDSSDQIHDKEKEKNLKVEDFEEEKPDTKTVEETKQPEQEKSEEKVEEGQKNEVNPTEIDDFDQVETKSLDTPEETSKVEEQPALVPAQTEDSKVSEVSTPPIEESKVAVSDEKPEETTKVEESKVASVESVSPPIEESKISTAEESKVSTTDKEESKIQPKNEEPEKETSDSKPEVKEAFKEETEPEKTVSTLETSESQELLTQVSESLTEEVTAPKSTLSNNKYDLLDHLNKFIQPDDELNDVLAGYYARLVFVLIQKKSEALAKYFYANERLLYRLAYHCYSKSLTDTIVKILDINAEKIDLDEAEVKRIRAEFVKVLLERLSDDKSSLAHEYSLNIFHIFNELTYKKAYYDLLVEQSVLTKLGEILDRDTPECTSNSVIRILNVLISTLRDNLSNNKGQNSKQQFRWMNAEEDDVLIQEDNDEESKDANEKLDEKIKSHNLVTFMKDKVIDYLVPQLEKAPEKSVIDFQYGDNKYVLGKKRLACVNLMESLVELNDPEIRDKIMSTEFYEKLFYLFLEFPLNTFLQLHFDNIFHYIIKDEATPIETKVNLIKKIKIFEVLPSFWSENQQFEYPSQRTFRHGYQAFTVRFANTLKELSKSAPELIDLMSSDEWKEFYEKDVEVYNEKNSIVLANRNRKDSEELQEDDEDDMRFGGLEERDDLEDDDEEDDDSYNQSRNSMRDTLQHYDPSKNLEEHENEYVDREQNANKDEDQQLFAQLGRYEDSSSDEDTPIGEVSEKDEDKISESSDYYDSNYWQVNQYSIEDLLNA